MRRKKKKDGGSQQLDSPARQLVLAYPADMAATAIETLNRESDAGPESVLGLCQQMMGKDGEFVLVSLLSGFSVSDLKAKDPKLAEFKDSFRASLKDNPRALFSLIGTLKKAIARVQSASISPDEKAALNNLTDQFKTKFGL